MNDVVFTYRNDNLSGIVGQHFFLDLQGIVLYLIYLGEAYDFASGAINML
jgi:hypothetical protein